MLLKPKLLSAREEELVELELGEEVTTMRSVLLGHGRACIVLVGCGGYQEGSYGWQCPDHE